MDASFNSVNKEMAIIIGKGYYDSIGFKLDCFLVQTDILFMSSHFNDSTLSSLEGFFQQYYDGKNIEARGYYENNEKQGVWENLNKQGEKTDSAFYNKGVRLRYGNYTYFKDYNKNNNGLYYYEFTDSLANTLDGYYFSDSGTLAEQVKFIGQTGIWTHFNNGGITTDTVYKREKKEAEFPGGNKGWAMYLEKALGSFNPADHGTPGGKWQVIVKFIVSEDGTISDVKAETDFGHKMEETVINVITNGPKWIPAKQFGKPVKAYRRQPVTFIVENP
jgi:antitoxin component YwqK of YwqJK toxin-antitoxin module